MMFDSSSSRATRNRLRASAGTWPAATNASNAAVACPNPASVAGTTRVWRAIGTSRVCYKTRRQLSVGRVHLMSEPNEDVVWVARCLRGDTRAFEALVNKYQRALFTLSLHLVGDYEDARDATQNTFVRAYERLETYDPGRKFFSWIYRIAVNESLNLRRSRKVHEPVDDSFVADPPSRDAIET